MIRKHLDWPSLAALLQGAAVYVGPDTSMTHLAAGAGCPTVALYGPTSPRLIGPWPVGGLAEPWEPAGTIQRRGNVWVVQNPLPCLPCEKLGCAGHLDSHSQCLDELSGPPGAALRGRSGAAAASRASRHSEVTVRDCGMVARAQVLDFFAGAKFERRVRLLVALIDHNAGARVDDLVVLNEDGVGLRRCRARRA